MHKFVLLYLLILLDWDVIPSQCASRSKRTKRVSSTYSETNEWWDFSGKMPSQAHVAMDDPYLEALDIFFRRLSTSQQFSQHLWESLPERWNASETKIPIPNFDSRNLTFAAASGALRSSGDTYFTENSHHGREATFFSINESLARSGHELTPEDLELHFDAGATLSVNKAGVVWPWIGTTPCTNHALQISPLALPFLVYIPAPGPSLDTPRGVFGDRTQP